MEANIFANSTFSFNNRSMSICFESRKRHSQNLVSLADFNECCIKFTKSLFVEPACASIIFAPMLVALRISCLEIISIEKYFLFKPSISLIISSAKR